MHSEQLSTWLPNGVQHYFRTVASLQEIPINLGWRPATPTYFFLRRQLSSSSFPKNSGWWYISPLFVFSKCRREGRSILFRHVGAVDFAIHTPSDKAKKSATDLPTGAVTRVVSVLKHLVSSRRRYLTKFQSLFGTIQKRSWHEELSLWIQIRHSLPAVSSPDRTDVISKDLVISYFSLEHCCVKSKFKSPGANVRV
jgi:hypothetical protein